MSEEQIKTIKFDFNDPEDRNAAFDRICELRCLDKEKARIDLKITGRTVPHQKIIELCNKQDCTMIMSVEVTVKPAVGAAAIKAPDGIAKTAVDSVATDTKTESTDDLF